MDEFEERPELNLRRPPRSEGSQAKPNTDYIRKVNELVTQAFTVSRVVKTSKRNRTIVSGGKVPTDDRKGEVTLLRMTQWPKVVYCVDAEDLDPTEYLFHLDLSTGEAYSKDKVTPYNQKSILTFLQRLCDSALAPKQEAKRRRRRRLRLVSILTTVLLAVAGAATGGYFLIDAWTETTNDPIRSEKIYDTRPDAQPIDWSDQYDNQDVSSLDGTWSNDEDEEVPADKPHEVIAPFGSILDKCDSHTRDIKPGQHFRAVFKGQRGDGFTIRFDHQNNEIEICRTGSEGADIFDGVNKKDKVYIQRVDVP